MIFAPQHKKLQICLNQDGADMERLVQGTTLRADPADIDDLDGLVDPEADVHSRSQGFVADGKPAAPELTSRSLARMPSSPMQLGQSDQKAEKMSEYNNKHPGNAS